MKNKTLKLFVSVVLAVVLAFALTIIYTVKDHGSVAHATVGGATYLADFRYSPEDESIYFTRDDRGGRGCLPELVKLSLNTGKTSTVYSCDQAESLVVPITTSRSDMVNKIIREFTSDFSPLTELDLKKNNIAIDVNFVRAENYGPGVDGIVRRFFKASVYQNKVKINEFEVVGCNLEQPFIFQGYSIPGYNKRIAILLSTKGNCFEGGYIYETLYSINGVDKLNKTASAGGFYKGLSALAPNEGNLVVYEADAVGSVGTDDTSADDTRADDTKDPKTKTPVTGEKETSGSGDKDGADTKYTGTVLIAILCIIIGLVIGKVMYRKS